MTLLNFISSLICLSIVLTGLLFNISDKSLFCNPGYLTMVCNNEFNPSFNPSFTNILLNTIVKNSLKIKLGFSTLFSAQRFLSFTPRNIWPPEPFAKATIYREKDLSRPSLNSTK
ncbi:MAG: hypothetical protein ACOCWC_05520 [Bacteroidota bacterium]